MFFVLMVASKCPIKNLKKTKMQLRTYWFPFIMFKTKCENNNNCTIKFSFFSIYKYNFYIITFLWLISFYFFGLYPKESNFSRIKLRIGSDNRKSQIRSETVSIGRFETTKLGLKPEEKINSSTWISTESALVK